MIGISLSLSLGNPMLVLAAVVPHSLSFEQADGASTGSATLRQWTPDDLTSITVATWGRADLDLSAGNVASWGHVNALTEATNQPVYNATGWNGKPSATFDGTNDKLIGGSATAVANGNDAAFSVIVAAKMNNANTSRDMWSMGRSSSSAPFMRMGNTSAWSIQKHDDAAGQVNVGGLGASDQNAHVFSVVHAGATVSSWLDGTAKDSAAAQNVGDTTLDQFALSCAILGGVPSRFMASDYHGFIVGTGQISSTERAIAEAWIAL